MTILVYGEKAGRSHENLMLQAFLERLEDRWATSDDWIMVIANAMWNGAEIDLVCLLPSAILVADFKSHGGKLTGTENGPWQADGVLVKGGRKANPYQQLRDNKFSILNWLESKTLLAGRNLGHIAAGVVFSGGIDDRLELPAKVRSWLYPTDLDTCAALLDGLASPELSIDRKEALEIVQRLGAQPIEWTSTRPRVRAIEPRPIQPHGRTPLTEHQKEALQTLRGVIGSDEKVTCSVLGMTSTGKSRLLMEACEEITKTGKKAIVLEPNRRLAEGARWAGYEVSSIYAHMYIGSAVEEEELDTSSEQKKLKVIPLRQCEDNDDCIYLLDDAHLLGNSRFTTPDGKQYGSGQLLADFFDFAGLGKTRRKALFFGDPYQIQRAGEEESVLTGGFQKSRGLMHQTLELTQIIDTTGGSAALDNAERLVAAIRTQKFSSLELASDERFRITDKDGARQAAAEILDRYREDPHSVWCLAETHAKANALTRWLRERLRGKKVLGSVEEGDLLEVYVSPDVQDSVGSTFSVQSGGRLAVASVGGRTEYTQGLKWAKNNPVRFHSVYFDFGAKAEYQLGIFEEFLTAEKPELDKETAVAESVWRNSIKKEREKVLKGKQDALPGFEQAMVPPPAPDFAYVRYGYATTVHHAQGMSQPVCYVNCEHSAGLHSEGFFRWLYSALTVAERQLVLLNFADIHPFDSATWNAGGCSVSSDISVGAGWSFTPNGIVSEKDQQRSLPPGLDQSGDVLKSVAIWLRIASSVEPLGWKVAKAACHNYQEQYELAGPNGEQCQLRIPYNGKNVVTAIHVKDAAFWPLVVDVASACIEVNGYSPEAESLLRSARSRLGGCGWRIVSATESAYRLLITVVRCHDERASIEANFDKQGLVSSLRLLHASDLGLLDQIKEALL
ncbi:NERD domain-containing protein [Stenotrophomonas panacihumi]|nr:NERD domain-containing protein [Stenotrophomonas panacihumi]